MYKIVKTFRSQHVVEALDGEGDLARAVQRSSYKKPLEVVAACLAPPTATAARARAATPGADLGTDSGGTVAAQLLLGVGGGHHSVPVTVEFGANGTQKQTNRPMSDRQRIIARSASKNKEVKGRNNNKGGAKSKQSPAEINAAHSQL